MAIELGGSVIGFASGIGVSIIGALWGSTIQKWRDRQRRREQAAFEIFMLLLELNGQYFWIASSELRGEPAPTDAQAKAKTLAWRIADKLREIDDVEHLEEILTVLMKEDAFKTAHERALALDALIDKLGVTVNPRYAQTIRRISECNVRGLAGRLFGHRNNAPGLM